MKDSIYISFGKLAVLSGDSERQPLSFLNDDCHIHGELRIEIGGRSVPYLGYFGPDDVCFSTWIQELDAVSNRFAEGEVASYIFDEGEQSQPAYLFEKEGEKGFLSIVASPLSETEGDSDWQRVEFKLSDFLMEYERFRSNFIKEIETAAPKEYTNWIANFISLH